MIVEIGIDWKYLDYVQYYILILALLGTIPEADTEQPLHSPLAQQQVPPVSRRSVRFAEVPPTPPQPPSSPNASSRPTTPLVNTMREDVTGLRLEAPLAEEDHTNQSDNPMEGVMVINKLKGKPLHICLYNVLHM